MAKHRSFRLTRATPVVDASGSPLISSRWTHFNKRVFPAVLFGILSLPLIFGVWRADEPSDWFQLVPVLVMMGFGYVILRRSVFDLADEVWDLGDRLVVMRGRIEQRIELRDIQNVSFQLSNPLRVTVLTSNPGPWGHEVVFAIDGASSPWLLFGERPKVYTELLERVVAARGQGAASAD